MATPSQQRMQAMHFAKEIHNDTYDYINPTQFNLQGKAVLITGASRGIGKEIALSFARAGVSQIAISARSMLEDVARDVVKAATEVGHLMPSVLPLKLDVEDYDDVAAAANRVEAEFGRLDILVSSAGFLETEKLMVDSDPNVWKKTWSVNIFGTYHVIRAFMPLLEKSENGLKELLIVSSIGSINVTPGLSAYQTSKLAALRLAECVCAEHPNVLAYSIHPGAVLTELATVLPKQFRDTLIDTPQLAGDAVVFLLAERREFLAGRYVSVTWDMKEIVEEKKAEIEKQNLLKMRMAFQ